MNIFIMIGAALMGYGVIQELVFKKNEKPPDVKKYPEKTPEPEKPAEPTPAA